MANGFKGVGNRPVGLFLGSGASYPKPSELPTFNLLRENWIAGVDEYISSLGSEDHQNSKSELLVKVREIPPEAFFQIFDACSPRETEAAFRECLTSDEPNPNHEIAAKVFESGGTIWTTNFDTLVETALGIAWDDTTLVAFDQKDTRDLCEDLDIRLIKPHGTLPNPASWIFRSRDVLKPLTSGFENRLRKDVAEHYFAFLGYSASDLDIKPVLIEILNRMGTGIWFCQPGQEEARIHKLFGEAIREGRLSVISSDDPSALFHAWCKDVGLIDRVPNPSTEPRPYIVPFMDLLERPFVYTNLFRRIWALDLSVLALKPHLRRYKKGALHLYVSIKKQQGQLASRVLALIWAIGKLIGGPTWNERNDGLYSISYQAFAQGRYRWSVLASRILLNHASAERIIQLAAGLRMCSNFNEALTVLETLGEKQRAEQVDDASMECRIYFERAECLRWLGKETEALGIINGLDADRMKHADMHWRGWLLFEKATCLTLRGEFAEAQDACLQAAGLFKDAVFDRWGLLNAQVLNCTIFRFTDKPEEADEALESAQKSLASSSRAAFARATLEFERAEILRQKDEYDQAYKSYRTLFKSTSPLHRCHGALGIAELERNRSQSNKATKWANKALIGYRDMGCKWGECNAILTLVLNGDMNAEAGLALAKDSMYIMPDYLIREFEELRTDRPRRLNLP